MRKPKHNYDDDKFYEDIMGYAMQGFTDAEIADALDLNPDVFGSMKNGNYAMWNKKQNAARSERLNRVLSRGRTKINAIVRSAYLKAALGGKKVKKSIVKYVQERCECEGKNKHCPYCGGTGWVTLTDKAVAQEETEELYPNVQAMSMWLLHHDPEWRKIERKQDNDEGVPAPDEVSHGVNIEDWIKTEIKNKKND